MKITEYRDASDSLTVEIYDIPVWKYSWVKWKLRKKFKLKGKSNTVITFDERFQELLCKEAKVSIDWDIWSGFTVTSLNNESELLVKKIREYLKAEYAQ